MNNEDAVKMAMENVKYEGITDVFEKPFELDALKDSAFVALLATQLGKALNGRSFESLNMSPIHHVLVPKRGRAYDFRRCALIEPQDTIQYLSLSLLCAEEIEKRRANKDRVFSYRFNPLSDGSLWNSVPSQMRQFNEATRARARRSNIKVVAACDIANFYDRLNLHRLESTLQSIGIAPWVSKCLNAVLTSWSKTDSYGLPVGSNASRILAEAALIEVDRYLISIGADFCRFVDDYRFFAPSAAVAQEWLCYLIMRLSQEGLTLNAAKTRLRSVGDISHSTGEDSDELQSIADNVADIKGSSTGGGGVEESIPIFGYGRVPRRFSMPKKHRIDVLKGQDPSKLLLQILSTSVPEIASIIELLQVIVLRLEFSILPKVVDVILVCPPIIDAFVDLLARYRTLIPHDVRSEVARLLGNQIVTASIRLPEWYTARILWLLGEVEYSNMTSLLEVFRRTPREAGIYTGRVTLDAMHSSMDRGTANELKTYFDRSHPLEQRSILRALKRALPAEEHRAWTRYAKRFLADDAFALWLLP